MRFTRLSSAVGCLSLLVVLCLSGIITTSVFASSTTDPIRTAAAHSRSTNTNATHPPVFPPQSNSPPLRRLHTDLATLLPILPILSPPPSHTLLVTFATAAFKPLLYNFLCFLRYRAKWAKPFKVEGYPDLPHEDVLKLLVVTSDPDFAKELSDEGVVVWLLKSANLDALLDDQLDDAALRKELAGDLFLNLRLLDLLLGPHPPEGTMSGEAPGMLKWGSLHYQSLMLERTLVMSTLVGALVESQKVQAEDRWKEEDEWKAKSKAHDWSKSRLYREPFVGVKGVLVVDNDAVWLSNPSSHLSHPYRVGGTHPSIIWAPDSATHFKNAWGGISMPCACFVYSRVFDDLSHTASHLDPSNEDLYHPSSDAAVVWRTVALCHIAFLLKALEQAREQALRSQSGAEELVDFLKAVAPSFQASALGPAMYLNEHGGREERERWGRLGHEEWMDRMSSGVEEDLLDLLREVGVGPEGETCLALAQRNYDTSPNPNLSLGDTSLSSPLVAQRPPVRTEPLPYAHFPPGLSFFQHDQEEGVKPCVVHANYASGKYKEQNLRTENLWALVQEKSGKGKERKVEYKCDARVMERA